MTKYWWVVLLFSCLGFIAGLAMVCNGFYIKGKEAAYVECKARAKEIIEQASRDLDDRLRGREEGLRYEIYRR